MDLISEVSTRPDGVYSVPKTHAWLLTQISGKGVLLFHDGRSSNTEKLLYDRQLCL